MACWSESTWHQFLALMNKRVNSSYAMIDGLHRKDEKGYDEKRIIDDGWNMEDGGRKEERVKI